MYIADLEPCHYGGSVLDASKWNSPLLAVGWLDKESFVRGTVSDLVLPKLEAFVESASPALRCLGTHCCPFCSMTVFSQTTEYERTLWSTNFLVPGDQVIYASPGGIVHYIDTHQYLPPSAFIQSVLNSPPPGTLEHHEALKAANGGMEPPLAFLPNGLESLWDPEYTEKEYFRLTGRSLREDMRFEPSSSDPEE